MDTSALKTEDTAQAMGQAQEQAPGKSWGDRFKKTVFDKFTYVGLNFFVNAFGSAALAYAIERKFGARVEKASQSAGHAAGKLTGIDAERLTGGFFKAARAFFLTFAGNMIAPVIKLLEDRRRRIEFRVGHALDSLQEKLGKGNGASRQNLADYAAITSNPASLSAEARTRMEEKHHIVQAEGSLEFKEHKLGWMKVITARIVGWIAADVTNFLFGITNKNQSKWMRYSHYENAISPKVETGLKHLPGFSRSVAEPRHFADLLSNDGALTVVSSVTHKLVQNVLHREPATETRKKIVEAGPQSAMTREENRGTEAAAGAQM